MSKPKYTGREILNFSLPKELPKWWYEGAVQVFDRDDEQVQLLPKNLQLLYISFRHLTREMNTIASGQDFTFDYDSEPRNSPLAHFRNHLKWALEASDQYEVARRQFWREIRKFSKFPKGTKLMFMIGGSDGDVFLTSKEFSDGCMIAFVDGPTTHDGNEN